jgi:hypothetical protein
MWHAAEGDLHAYLDGALDHYPSGDAQRIREHLESCPECRQRLEEERALAARAREVLAGSGPAQLVAPPFEEIRRRAESGARVPELPRRFNPQRLAWAATVVMALGIGWRIGVGSGPGRASLDELAVPPAEAPGAAREADQSRDLTATVEESASAPAAGAGASQPAEREQGGAALQTAPAPEVASGRVLSDAAAALGAAPPPATVAQEGARGASTPPAASFSFRAQDFRGEGVRGGLAAGRAAGATDSTAALPASSPASPTSASPLGGRALALDGGRITGLTLAAGTQAPMSEVQVYLVGQNVGALTRQNGQYVLDNVPPGTYELRAERIGMTTQSRQVTVAAGQNIEANFGMVEQALGLDEIVVTGTAGAARRREVGNSIAVVPTTAPLSLPGVPIRSVDWVEVAPGVQGIRVEQGVEGVPVQLYFVGVQLETPASADLAAREDRARSAIGAGAGAAAPQPAGPPPPAASPPPPRPAGGVASGVAGGRPAQPASPAPRAAFEPPASLITVPLPTGWRQLAQPFRGGWVIIRAPLPDARLRELLERAGAGQAGGH